MENHHRQANTLTGPGELWRSIEHWEVTGSAIPSPKSPSLLCCLHFPTFPWGWQPSLQKEIKPCGSPVALLIIFNDWGGSVKACCPVWHLHYSVVWHQTANHGTFDHNIFNSSACILKIKFIILHDISVLQIKHTVKEGNTSQQRALSRSLESLSITGTGLCSSCQSSSGKHDCE